MPLTVKELKSKLDQLPDNAEVSYRFNGELTWSERDNTLYVSEV